MLRDVGEGLVSRSLSSLVVTVYIIVAFAAGGALAGIRMAAFCLFAWCCVWLPGPIGTKVVPAIGRNARGTPATMVWFVGWALLLLPIVVFSVLWMQGVNGLTMDWRTG
jgi:hypothetical protein